MNMNFKIKIKFFIIVYVKYILNYRMVNDKQNGAMLHYKYYVIHTCLVDPLPLSIIVCNGQNYYIMYSA